jgi:hypothetical protein
MRNISAANHKEPAEHFNLMAAGLQESYAHLEQKVADRTKELVTLNATTAQASQSLDLEEILKNALDEVLEARLPLLDNPLFFQYNERAAPGRLHNSGITHPLIVQGLGQATCRCPKPVSLRQNARDSAPEKQARHARR